MQMIRYHPLIDGDTDGLEKVPMFLSTDKETVRQNSRMYLSEIISNYYRLYSKEPMSQNATDSIEIHCPLCGAVLKQMAWKNLYCMIRLDILHLSSLTENL